MGAYIYSRRITKKTIFCATWNVVYFDQCLGAGQSKYWSNKPFQSLLCHQIGKSKLVQNLAKIVFLPRIGKVYHHSNTNVLLSLELKSLCFCESIFSFFHFISLKFQYNSLNNAGRNTPQLRLQKTGLRFTKPYYHSFLC